MSYYKTFVPPKEAMDKYKASVVDFSDLIRLQTITSCMEKTEKDNIYNAYAELKKNLESIDFAVKNEVFKNVYEQYEKEGKVWFCGWQYSHDNYLDKEDIMAHTLKQLAVLKMVVKTPDYFDEREKFDKKLYDVEEIIDDLKDALHDCWIYKVIEDLEPYAEKEEPLKEVLNENEEDK